MFAQYCDTIACQRVRNRQILPYIRGIFCLTRARPTLLSDESRHQLGKLQKICDANEPAALADDDLWVGSDDVRPLPRHRAHAFIIDAQQEPRAVPVVPLADADELLPAEWVERVRHAYKTCRRVGRACNLC